MTIFFCAIDLLLVVVVVVVVVAAVIPPTASPPDGVPHPAETDTDNMYPFQISLRR